MKKINFSSQAIQPYIDRIEGLSRTQRVLISIFVIGAIIGAFVYFSIVPLSEEIRKLSKEHQELNNKLSKMKAEAAQLGKYRKMMAEAEAQFMVVRKALPDKKEIPALLTSISQSGHESGLEFLLFEPKNEELKDFYAEIPVAISVAGNYHHVGLFLSRVAGLHRVVNIRDLQMKPTQDGGALNTLCTAVTYRFVETPPETKTNSANTKKK